MIEIHLFCKAVGLDFTILETIHNIFLRFHRKVNDSKCNHVVVK